MNNELFSRIYAFLGDRTSQPDGDVWEHGPLNRLVRDLESLTRSVEDAAEARGRAELAAKVRELADELERTPVPVGWTGADAADRLRALIADDTARTTSSRGPTTDTDAPPPV